jgi:alpha-beta hydrolase superfamily lysophospholipase
MPTRIVSITNELRCTVVRAEHASGSVIVVCHGVHQHAGLYNDFADRLCSAGYSVVSYDLRGFGESAGVRGMTADKSFGQAVEDLKRIIIGVGSKELSAGGKLFVSEWSLDHRPAHSS